MAILWMILFIIGGILLVYLGAELLVRSSVKIALYLEISHLVVGLTIVSFATSTPEIFISLFGQLRSALSDISLGNILGANITNTTLVLALALFIHPCRITKVIKWQKMPLMFLTFFLLFFMMLGGEINRIEAAVLFLGFILYTYFQYVHPPKKEEIEKEIKIFKHNSISKKSFYISIFLTFLSIIALGLGAKFLIEGALRLGSFLHVSERIMSLSVISFGTTCPEIFTAIVAALKKEEEIVLGTVIGSNIFNPLFIIPVAALIHPLHFSSNLLLFDLPIMVGFSLILWFMMLQKKQQLFRIEGMILLLFYFAYLTFLFTFSFPAPTY